MGSLARALETVFTERGLAIATDQAERLAAGRRRNCIDATPPGMRDTAVDFADFMLRARERARCAGTKPRSDRTIELGAINSARPGTLPAVPARQK